MVDLGALQTEWKLEYQEAEDLAAWVDSGRELTPRMREYIVQSLRGELPKKRGLKRSWAQVLKEAKIVSQVEYLKEFEEIGISPSPEQFKLFVTNRVFEWLDTVDKLARHRTKNSKKGAKERAMSTVAEVHDISVDSIKNYERNLKR